MTWIDQFIEATEGITSPLLFRKWAAIATVAGALERKVWVKTAGSALYPNLYVVLVGPPGVGKTEPIWRVKELWDALPEHHTAHSSLTKAALIDNLNESVRTITNPDAVPAVTVFNSLLVAQNELGVLIPAYDTEFMNTLTDLFDGKPYSEKRRSKPEPLIIKRPNVNLIAGCTPSYLSGTLPEGAWDQGFTSRIILIYSGEVIRKSLFAEGPGTDNSGLIQGLKTIGGLMGRMSFTEPAGVLINRWHMSGGKPSPEHPKLIHYNTRRTVQALKLSMVSAVSEGNFPVIEERHIQEALDWLTEAELYMSDIFKAMANSSSTEVIKEVWHYVWQQYQKGGKKGVSETRVINYVTTKTPAHNVDRILDVMVRGGLLEKKIITTGYGYVPLAPED